jgi:predicted metal-dependent hydrolase
MHPISYTIRRHPRAKYVRITVKADARVVVSAPKRVSTRFISTFVMEKQSWIAQEQQKLRARSADWEQRPGIAQDSFQSSKARALKFVRERLIVLNASYGYVYGRVSVKQMSSRWGSCSSEGNMSFHYRLLFLPIELADYVIVHELCHLVELNHSQRFWRLVAKSVPDYRQRRHALEQYHI